MACLSRMSQLLLVVTLVGCLSGNNVAMAQPTSQLDPRLESFLAYAIKDKNALEKEKSAYADQKVSFEQFIFLIYSATIKIDETPDNSSALAQLGGYLEKHRPTLSPTLLKQMEKFVAVKSNQTFMREMFLNTVRGLNDKR